MKKTISLSKCKMILTTCTTLVYTAREIHVLSVSKFRTIRIEDLANLSYYNARKLIIEPRAQSLATNVGFVLIHISLFTKKENQQCCYRMLIENVRIFKPVILLIPSNTIENPERETEF